jgi:hypothetical protein
MFANWDSLMCLALPYRQLFLHSLVRGAQSLRKAYLEMVDYPERGDLASPEHWPDRIAINEHSALGAAAGNNFGPKPMPVDRDDRA